MIAMVLQTRGATPGDVSGALSHLEPVCARLCAARPDRATEVVPPLLEAISAQKAEFDDAARYNANARRFHETLVARCGSETMILVIGALETIWSAHETAVWDEATAIISPNDPSIPHPLPPAQPEDQAASPLATRIRRAALRDHEKLLAAIEAGDEEKAAEIAGAHLAATRRSTLASSTRTTINANLVGGIDLARGRRPET